MPVEIEITKIYQIKHTLLNFKYCFQESKMILHATGLNCFEIIHMIKKCITIKCLRIVIPKVLGHP